MGRDCHPGFVSTSDEFYAAISISYACERERMLDAQRLLVLAEVAHAGSIASAAERLAFTPSAVSQQIGKLERDLGCRLLRRHPRGVTLTPAGQVLLSHAETVVGELRAAEQAVQAALDSERPRLAVGTFASAGQSLVPQALARFRQHHPDAALTLLEAVPGPADPARLSITVPQWRYGRPAHPFT